MLTTYLYLVPNVRMSGAVPVPSIYAFMAWKGHHDALLFMLSVTFVRFTPDVKIMYLAFLLHMRPVPHSNSGPVTGCSDSVLRGFYDSFQVNAVIILSVGVRGGAVG